ncbi:1-acyl-sn-glycerol-3-phosphate acyltransferase [Aurantimonas sp. Leaf443]|uniref:lysophospholipid acyltransferase family protein n=1 Tax=Aurantimonas sp. Leaf443 TaxID=1736378 RepID=UPI0006F85A71|nr:1-acyl-sn-glycerol-3-phosphate acyltransferase [Aurantimonas sp. Leaf443]KQT83938.1 acyl-phosphate glycerol 3-phosphate acyltransferase [Aurantimonas sp. Leaf443]
MIGKLRVALVAAVLVAMTLLLMPLQLLATRRGWPLAARLPRLWHRVACRVAGLRVTVVGAPARGRPLLIAANHQSWADIMVMGAAAEISFIAKAEVRSWPGFGLLARLQRTVFVEREARRRTGHQADAIARRMSAGDAMVLFAEGTTSNGNLVLPFKTSLFGAAQAALAHSGADTVMVQPAAIAYTRANGLPLGRYARPIAAWPGDVALGPHLLAFLKEGAIDAEIRFCEPMPFTAASNRKLVAATAERAVARALAEALSGRAPGQATPTVSPSAKDPTC